MTRDEIKDALPIQEEFERRGVEFKRIGSRLMAKCPFHEDGKPSLSLDEKDQLFHCHAGCGGGSVIDAWALFEGVSVKDAFSMIERHLGFPKKQEMAPQKTTPPPADRKLVKSYDYRDENGELLYQVCRFDPKDFRQRVPNGSGWTWGLGETRRVIYNLPDVASSQTAIYFCEGEKDADLIHGMGLCATTTPMGAGKWDDSFTATFKAKTIVILPDNDAPGKKHCQLLCEKLGPVARAVIIVDVPAPHKDVSDWRREFSSDQEFGMRLIEMSRKAKVVAGADTLPIYSMEDMEKRYKESILSPKRATLDLSCISPKLGKLIRPLVPGDFCAIVADTGVGKTFILQNIAANCGVKVLFFELELNDETMFERFSSIGSGAATSFIESFYREGKIADWRRKPTLGPNVFLCPKPGLTCADIRSFIIQSEMKIGEMPAVVMVDYVGLIRGVGSSKYEKMSGVAEDLKTIAKELGVVMVICSQISRKGDDSTEEIHLHDAKDSGSIENSVQLALGMWRDPDPEKKTRIWTKILKNTKGQPGAKVPLQFNPSNLQLFEEASFCETTESELPLNGSGKKSTSSYPHRRMHSR